jgi:hypothetical protein
MLKFGTTTVTAENKGNTGKCRCFPNENYTCILPHLLSFVNSHTAILKKNAMTDA